LHRKKPVNEESPPPAAFATAKDIEFEDEYE
jgi:hypothetical protein